MQSWTFHWLDDVSNSRNHNIPPLMHLNISAAGSRCALSNWKTLHTVTTLILSIPQMTRMMKIFQLKWQMCHGEMWEVDPGSLMLELPSLGRIGHHWSIQFKGKRATVASNDSPLKIRKLCPCLDPTVGSGSPVGSPKLQKCLPQWEKRLDVESSDQWPD